MPQKPTADHLARSIKAAISTRCLERREPAAWQRGFWLPDRLAAAILDQLLGSVGGGLQHA
jgi:hypothetical protein